MIIYHITNFIVTHNVPNNNTTLQIIESEGVIDRHNTYHNIYIVLYYIILYEWDPTV